MTIYIRVFNILTAFIVNSTGKKIIHHGIELFGERIMNSMPALWKYFKSETRKDNIFITLIILPTVLSSCN